MIENLWIIVIAWIVGAGSPGPATLAISATAMEQGRRSGVTIALGIVAGSACWGIAAALGISSLMIANAWLFELVRYLGAAYLLYLAIKSFKSALVKSAVGRAVAIKQKLFLKGMLLHLTNPKAILGWGSIYAIALPVNADAFLVVELFAILICTSSVVFVGYGFLFSNRAITIFYKNTKRWFELFFGILFGAASVRLFTSKLEAS